MTRSAHMASPWPLSPRKMKSYSGYSCTYSMKEWYLCMPTGAQACISTQKLSHKTTSHCSGLQHYCNGLQHHHSVDYSNMGLQTTTCRRQRLDTRRWGCKVCVGFEKFVIHRLNCDSLCHHVPGHKSPSAFLDYVLPWGFWFATKRDSFQSKNTKKEKDNNCRVVLIEKTKTIINSKEKENKKNEKLDESYMCRGTISKICA